MTSAFLLLKNCSYIKASGFNDAKKRMSLSRCFKKSATLFAICNVNISIDSCDFLSKALMLSCIAVSAVSLIILLLSSNTTPESRSNEIPSCFAASIAVNAIKTKGTTFKTINNTINFNLIFIPHPFMPKAFVTQNSRVPF